MKGFNNKMPINLNNRSMTRSVKTCTTSTILQITFFIFKSNSLHFTENK